MPECPSVPPLTRSLSRPLATIRSASVPSSYSASGNIVSGGYNNFGNAYHQYQIVHSISFLYLAALAIIAGVSSAVAQRVLEDLLGPNGHARRRTIGMAQERAYSKAIEASRNGEEDRARAYIFAAMLIRETDRRAPEERDEYLRQVIESSDDVYQDYDDGNEPKSGITVEEATSPFSQFGLDDLNTILAPNNKPFESPPERSQKLLDRPGSQQEDGMPDIRTHHGISISSHLPTIPLIRQQA